MSTSILPKENDTFLLAHPVNGYRMHPTSFDSYTNDPTKAWHFVTQAEAFQNRLSGERVIPASSIKPVK